MSLAMKRLKNIGWLLLVFLVALMLYPLSLNVAARHSDLVILDKKIQDTQREIDFLEAEIRTRASMAQLEEWNDVLYGYAPPTAAQFIEGERILADAGNRNSLSKPVLVSVELGGVAPSGTIGNGSPTGDAGAKPLTEVERMEIANASKAKEAVSFAQSRTDRLAQIEKQLMAKDSYTDNNDQEGAQ